MIYKCTNCGSALVYDATTGYLKCENCQTYFQVPASNVQNLDPNDNYISESGPETQGINNEPVDDGCFDINLYKCSSCGAELMLTNTDASTFCSFCGLPTIVFSRVAREKRPDKIIPFMVTKSQAVDLIRENVSGNKYVPEEIKNVNIESIHGIYMPYWIANIHAHARVEARRVSNKHVHTYHKELDAIYNITQDASEDLSNILSDRMEPFNLKDMVDFDPSYLSGIYADIYDRTLEEEKGVVEQKVRDATESAIRKTGSYSSMDIEALDYEINGAKYALFPAYFVTMRYQDRPYIVAVNGQTGTIAACLPISKPDLKKQMIKLSVTWSIILSIISVVIMFVAPLLNNAYELFFIPALIVFFTVLSGRAGKKQYEEEIDMYNSKSMNTYTNRDR